MKTLKIVFLLLSLCIGSFHVAQAQGNDLKNIEAKTDGCIVVAMIPEFDLDAEAGGFNPRTLNIDLKVKQGISANTGKWMYLKCPCPHNPEEKKLLSATVEGANLQLEETIKGPWNVSTILEGELLGLELSANASFGVVPKVGGGIESLGGTFSQNTCSSPFSKQVNLDAKVNAFVSVTVGAKATCMMTASIGGADIKYFVLTAKLVAAETKVESTGTFKYESKRFMTSYVGSELCFKPIDVKFGEIVLEGKVPSLGIDLTLADLSDGLFNGYKANIYKGECWKATY